MRRLVVGTTLSMLACGGDAWKIDDAPKVPPDYQYRTGVEAGADYWEWTCYEGHHVIISQSSSACYVLAPRMQKLPCGTPIAYDPLGKRPLRGQEIPEGYRWPNSDAGPPPYDGGDDSASSPAEAGAD